MRQAIEEIKKERGSLAEKVIQKEEKLVGIALDLVLNQLEDTSCSESNGDWLCPEMIDCPGELIRERIPLVLEVLHEEDFLERKVNMGILHYRLSK